MIGALVGVWFIVWLLRQTRKKRTEVWKRRRDALKPVAMMVVGDAVATARNVRDLPQQLRDRAKIKELRRMLDMS